jgi:hypothetical protein
MVARKYPSARTYMCGRTPNATTDSSPRSPEHHALSYDSAPRCRERRTRRLERGPLIEHFLRKCSDIGQRCFGRVPFSLDRRRPSRQNVPFSLERRLLNEERPTESRQRGRLFEHFVRKCSNNGRRHEHFRTECFDRRLLHEHFHTECSDRRPLPRRLRTACSILADLPEHFRRKCSCRARRRSDPRRF